MTMPLTDERLDALLRELLDARAESTAAAALPAETVAGRLAERVGLADRRLRGPLHPAWTPVQLLVLLALLLVMLLGAAVIGSQLLDLRLAVVAPTPTPTPTASPVETPPPDTPPPTHPVLGLPITEVVSLATHPGVWTWTRFDG